MGELHAVIDNLKPDFVFITETWLNNDILDSMIIPSDRYTIVRTDRQNRRGGGVCALINKRYSIIPIDTPLGVEIAAFDVTFYPTKYRFIVCYRPPDYDSNANNYLSTLFNCLHNLCAVNYSLFIVGDFNMPDVCWNDMSASGNHLNFSNIMLDFVSDHGLSQCVVEPTRNDNILDLVLTSDPLLINDCVVSPPFIDCDHMTVNFNVVLPASDVNDDDETLCYFNYAAADYEGLNSYFSSVNWFDVFPDNCDDINECWESFVSVVNRAIELFVPVKVFDPHLTKRDKKYCLYIYDNFIERKMHLGD